MTTDSLGSIAYGFSDLFTFSYTASTDNLTIHQNNSLSPSTSFLPYAVDYDGSRGIIAGFLKNDQNSRIKYNAIVLLFSIDASTATVTPITLWKYPMNGTTWQAGQTNAGANKNYPPSGYYSSTIGPTVEVVPAFSSQLPCMPGTYKNVTGIRRCLLCPPGTKTDGINLTITTCINCATNTFCPLGSVSDSISNDQLNNITQAVAYPKSPDIAGLDDILFFTLFSIGSSARCVALSPIFWTVIVAAIITLIVSVMLVIKYCVKTPKAVYSYKLFKKIFKRTDIIREGEMWVGGLATFCVIVLCVSCCVFSAKYYRSYPIETAGPSTYTCDTSIRNAQFSSSLQSLAVPVADNIQGMMDLLITVQFTLPNTYKIGGVRIGLSAPGKNKSSTAILRDLGFSQTFNQSGSILGQDVRITLQLTKVINNTNPLVSSDDEILSGIWIGSFLVNYHESFMTNTDYLNAPPKTSTNLTLTISETLYYILNEQSPIARLPEIIYHDFLYITMIIGMFVLIFVIVEILILPCITSLIRKCRRNAGDKYRTDSTRQSVSSHNNAENSSSHSNRQESREHMHDFAIVNNVTSLQRQKPTLNQYANRTEDDSQQLPTMWNRQAYH
ncbi:unnamed protein product [Rotaria sordida]|uniref:Tyrosine-protein kinase ephrin type A/B receptor-like domain-containing protein n=1 Tax=Rotaria sordida TaxID=392033 RepID=A0A814V3T9_9BILA|nr:unnamed protein product [Rotaria sordida]